MFRITITVIASLFLIQGCIFMLHESCRDGRNSVAKDYFQKKWDKQEPDFSDYSLENQYRIYVFGSHCIHPPLIYFADTIALRGKEAVSFLSKKLREEENDLAIHDIIYIFYQMSWRNTYDVAGDGELMALMEDSTEKIGSRDWKRISQKMINDIMSN